MGAAEQGEGGCSQSGRSAKSEVARPLCSVYVEGAQGSQVSPAAQAEAEADLAHIDIDIVIRHQSSHLTCSRYSTVCDDISIGNLGKHEVQSEIGSLQECLEELGLQCGKISLSTLLKLQPNLHVMVSEQDPSMVTIHLRHEEDNSPARASLAV